ncbi:NAD-dependent epimerase/dehydratase family protein [Thalassospira lucentensis]|uniref:NAD-dependent epimerase/dehydratase domain-containing protein n=1 Tax=Thalassospira lucentensis TaxID=168935 RepID=A0A358HZP9_9PROT|nr:NAD-dependent epimerase/dehydratase family protein [Thalassospira lucentensis]HBV00658.1 hypothetical protein [Thalassospira lucentensis]HCW67094.1 hypothetical protein [Thalassospira lucentensis]
MTRNSNRIALVIGANGGIGSAITTALHDHGWKVRALVRMPPKADQSNADDIDWRVGDAMCRHDVLNASRGVDVIIHAVNPPGYRNWSKLVLPMLDNTIAAAIVNKARIVLPGTVYNFNEDQLSNLTETSPQLPNTRKGAIRVEMERRMRRAVHSGATGLIVRAGDFFGPGANNNWFSQCLVKAGQPVREITYPGNAGVGHQWAYLPDVAETIVRLLDQPDVLGSFAQFHLQGHWDNDGTQMIAAIKRAVGNPDIPIKSLPWTMIGLLRPFVPFFREAWEIRYLWRNPARMHNDRLRALFGNEPHTPLDVAVHQTLDALGCLAPQDHQEHNTRPNQPVPTPPHLRMVG